MCDCCGCVTDQECYFKPDTEDKKFVGFEPSGSPIPGFQEFLERMGKKFPDTYEIVPRNFPDSKYDDDKRIYAYHSLFTMFTWEELEEIYLRECKRKERLEKTSRFRFYTISASGTNQKDMSVDKLLTFGRRIKKYYKEFEGVLEYGKHAERPHLHLHYLGIMRDSKNHMARLKTEWEKVFPGNMALYNKKKGDKEYYVTSCVDSDKMIPYDDWVTEKREYFKNELKGSHENFCNSVVI